MYTVYRQSPSFHQGATLLARRGGAGAVGMDDESTYERLKSLGYGGAMRSQFSLEEDYIQLNHGSVSAAPIVSPRDHPRSSH